jgi:3D (Asp-Asp-Asp) domain-containing protein
MQNTISMIARTALTARLAMSAALIAAAVIGAGGSAHAAGGGGTGLQGSLGVASGGAPVGGLAPTRAATGKIPGAPAKNAPGRWVRGVTITEYWPAPESWFVGRLVKAPGLAGEHRIDWLYSAMGLSMEGQGIGLDGRTYHINALGDGGWVTAAGAATSPADGWSAGSPFWRAGGYWRNRSGGVSFPLGSGGWSAGVGRAYVPLPGVTFAAGGASRLHFYESIAVDPSVIPLGSRVYVPAYRNDGHGGWFIAQDTGGAIDGRHIDVYRSPPAGAKDPGHDMTGKQIFVIKPH